MCHIIIQYIEHPCTRQLATIKYNKRQIKKIQSIQYNSIYEKYIFHIYLNASMQLLLDQFAQTNVFKQLVKK